jgi:hypothetical protein
MNSLRISWALVKLKAEERLTLKLFEGTRDVAAPLR